MTNRKKLLLVAVIFVVLLVIGAIIYVATRNTGTSSNTATSTQDVTLRVDPDTGEQTTSDPALSTSESEDAKDTTLLGVEGFITATSATRPQILYLRDSLHTYATTTLKGKYATLTIRPQDFVVNGDVATSTIRLGDTETFVNFRFTGLTNGTMTVDITDPTGSNGGNYKSVPQQYFEND